MAKTKTKRTKKKHQGGGPPAFEWRREVKHAQASIYVLHGDEPLFSREAALWVLNEALGDGIADFNLDRFDASDHSFSVDRLLNALNTLPMMASRRVVHVQSAEILNKVSKIQLKNFLAYCESPPRETCLILEARTRLDKGRALAKILTKMSSTDQVVMRESIPMDGRQIERWLSHHMQQQGLNAPSSVITLIQESADGRLGEMIETIEKVALYITPRVDVALQDVTDLVPEAQLQTTVWTLLDKLALRQTADVIALCHSLLNQGQEPLGLLALVHRRIRELTAAKSILSIGGAETQLGQVLSMNHYATKRVMQLARDQRSLNAYQLAVAYQRLAQADRILKGSKVSQKLALEHLLLEICTC